jgi:cytochrome P450
MPCLSGVGQEVLRLYASITITCRETVRETTTIGTKVRKGTTVLLFPYAANSNSKAWGETAELVPPERWIDINPETGEKSPNQHGGTSMRSAQMAFLYGPKGCIGNDFAKTELRCVFEGLFGQSKLDLIEPKQKIKSGGTVSHRSLGMHLLNPLIRVTGLIFINQCFCLFIESSSNNLVWS